MYLQFITENIDGFVPHCGIPSALAMEIPQCCNMPSIYSPEAESMQCLCTVIVLKIWSKYFPYLNLVLCSFNTIWEYEKPHRYEDVWFQNQFYYFFMQTIGNSQNNAMHCTYLHCTVHILHTNHNNVWLFITATEIRAFLMARPTGAWNNDWPWNLQQPMST